MRRFIVLALVLLSGCTFFEGPQHRRYRSSLVEYLYPGEIHAQETRPAQLQLPLKIGIAFVPAEPQPLDPQQEERLLEIVRKSFASRDWVGEIQLIPSSYLHPRGGFDDLEQVARLMNVDVVALVSVDQIQYNDPTLLSILYVSVVGQYVLPGDRNDTRTLIDVAAVDVQSHAFLLRAPGSSRISGMAAPVDVERRLRHKSDEGLRLAMLDLTKNLDTAVVSLKTSVAEGRRRDIDIISRKGVSFRAGGAMDPVSLVLMLIVIAAAFVPMRRAR
ncbi:MAG TPA: rhombotarget lipoprotein [Thermoanaerobaculia bacterium]|nr:rhombotarget lipoprotein [Thermoanaerobaculia bacterium]